MVYHGVAESKAEYIGEGPRESEAHTGKYPHINILFEFFNKGWRPIIIIYLCNIEAGEINWLKALSNATSGTE